MKSSPSVFRFSFLILVAAALLGGIPGIAAAQSGGATAPSPVTVEYFGEIGCSHCDTFVESEVPNVEQASGIPVEVVTYDILASDDYALCRDKLGGLDRPFRVFPVLFIGNNAYQGTSAVNRGLSEEIAYLGAHGTFRPQIPGAMDGSILVDPSRAESGELLQLLPILLAGLADGVNPCAFATVIFLLSLLTLVGRSRRQILATGIVFAATIFVTYIAIGFGLLSVLRAVVNASNLKFWLRLVVSLGTVVLAVLSIRDGYLISRGRRSHVVLGLSEVTRRRVHTVIRARVRTGGIVFATIGLAFAVSVLELACTGQLYLPTIAYLLQTGSTDAHEIGALAAYNVAFVLPLLIVVVIAWLGVGSRRISRWFSRRVVAAKILMGCVFALLGAAIWFA